MKRITIILIAVLMLMTGCATTKPRTENEKLNVYITTYPLYDFTMKIAGDCINATQIIPTGVDAHEYEPSPHLMAELERSDVFVFNGGGLEAWAERVEDSLSNEGVLVVNTGEGIAKNNDPHIWLSPVRAKQQAEKIYKALIKDDPENADYYTENYKALEKRFDDLDRKYRETLSKATYRDIITTHAAFAYLCEDYDLNQVSITGVSPGSEPSPGRMAEIIKFIKDNNIGYVFFEPLTTPRLADTIANETGIEKLVLDPVEGLTDEQKARGEDYFSLMEENLENLKKALVK
ncbi:MAG: metal ABC transporter substrate-binding protein [Thermoanaerobacteraceae bacterium]|nr:metal ABC transporter substrate-binding protein [Thermoanaerobacteraceae bacterium]